MSNDKKFVKGQIYRLELNSSIKSYEYIRNQGNKLHFFNNNEGFDILISNKDALSALLQ